MIKVEVSIGELIDKVSILRVKLANIKNENKLLEVKKECEILEEIVENLGLREVEPFVDKLFDINSELWDIEDKIRIKEKNKEFDQEFIDLARSVYVMNDKRFGVKNDINVKYKSGIKEQKEYEQYN